MEVSDLQHCSKCGETCNPGTGMTVNGDRFHKDACPVVNHVARAAAGSKAQGSPFEGIRHVAKRKIRAIAGSDRLKRRKRPI